MHTQRNLALLTKYQHQLGILENNPQVQRIQQRQKKGILTKNNKIHSFSVNKHNYNKWYINADLRYKKQQQDPRKQVKTLQKQDYLYNNLHNKQFWDWVHPLEGSARNNKMTDKVTEKVDLKALKNFKNYIESSPQKRLPLIVKSILEEKL